jgi:hypothetical protein
MLNKKGAATLILGIVLIIVIVGWLINFTGRECSEDNDCPENNYCGSDFDCHKHPVIEKEIAKNNLLAPSIILGLAIVISAVILRYKKS